MKGYVRSLLKEADVGWVCVVFPVACNKGT